MNPKRIDDNRLRLLWAREDLTVQQIAEMLGVSRNSVNTAVRRLTLPPRQARTAKAVADAVADAPAGSPEEGLTGFEVAVWRSQGRYAALGEAAALHGKTRVQALQTWHRLRAAS